jgi:hypothetical protein
MDDCEQVRNAGQSFERRGRTDMTHRMGRLTKRNRAKYRRRAYAVGMLRANEGAQQTASVEDQQERIPAVALVRARLDRVPRHVDDKRAA